MARQNANRDSNVTKVMEINLAICWPKCQDMGMIQGKLHTTYVGFCLDCPNTGTLQSNKNNYNLNMIEQQCTSTDIIQNNVFCACSGHQKEPTIILNTELYMPVTGTTQKLEHKILFVEH